MNTLHTLFYSLLLWCTQFELAVAKAAPVRNQRNIEALQRDESDYSRELIRLECGL